MTTQPDCAPAISYDKSPQWRDDHFENPPQWPARLGFSALLRWQFSGRPGQTPKDFRPPFVDNDGARLRENHSAPSVTWIGHATVLLQAGGLSMMTDPIFAQKLGFIRRLAPPGVAPGALPPIDVVVISHNHRDHLDEDSVRLLGPKVHFVVPLGLAAWFRKRGLPLVTELDWWQDTTIETPRGRARVTLVPAQHWSQRWVNDRNKTLWGGYVIEAGGRRFYFAGDTGYPAAFKEIGARYPGIDYALMPIGAYEPRWFMSSQHIGPQQAAQAFHELGARRIIPIHWGTFRLSDEPLDEPPVLLQKSMGADAARILQLAIGESHFDAAGP